MRTFATFIISCFLFAGCAAGADEYALHKAAAAGDLETIAMLLTWGAEINRKDGYGNTPLHYAAFFGKTDAAAILLSKGADPSAKDCRGDAPADTAARQGHVTTAGKLLEHSDQHLRGREKYFVWCRRNEPFADTDSIVHEYHHAINGNNRLKAEMMISRGVPIDAESAKNDQPLWIALKNNNLFMARFLIERGADASAPCPNAFTAQGPAGAVVINSGASPLTYAIMTDSLELAKTLLSHGAKVAASGSIDHLDLAIVRGSPSMTRLLFEKAADSGSDSACRAIESACRAGRCDSAAYFTEKADLNECGCRALDAAAGSGFLCAAKLLVGKGVSADCGKNVYLDNPLRSAVASGNLDMVRYLVDNGADIHHSRQPRNDALRIVDSPLVDAAFHGHEKIFHYFVESGANLDRATLGSALTQAANGYAYFRTSGAMQPFRTVSARTRNYRRIIDFLIARNAPLTFTVRGQGALSFSVMSGDLGLVRLLLDRGARIDAAAGIAAGMTDNEDVFRLLLDRAEEWDKSDFVNAAFVSAVARNDTERARLLLPGVTRIDVHWADGRSPLHHACEHANIELVKEILNMGADVNVKRKRQTPRNIVMVEPLGDNSTYGDTPLHLITRSRSKKEMRLIIMQFLLQRFADPNARNERGETPLHVAVRNSDIDAARMLVRYGAWCRLKNNEWQSPLDIAMKTGDTELIQLIAEGDPLLSLPMQWLANGWYGWEYMWVSLEYYIQKALRVRQESNLRPTDS